AALALLDERERVAVGNQRDDGEERVPVLDAHGQRTRVGHDRERPSAEHHRRRDPAVELADLGARAIPRAAEVPALERLTAVGELASEAPDGPVDRQVVVAEEVGHAGDAHRLDGIPQLNAAAGADRTGIAPPAAATRAGGTSGAAAAALRAPVVATAIVPSAAIDTATDPSVSVRSTRAPVAARRSIVERAG